MLNDYGLNIPFGFISFPSGSSVLCFERNFILANFYCLKIYGSETKNRFVFVFRDVNKSSLTFMYFDYSSLERLKHTQPIVPKSSINFRESESFF
jgi:hypothetical protein